ncbi:MAG: hypothetical protein AB1758_16750 [Candidatus Eremiobacterota bacterium]
MSEFALEMGMDERIIREWIHQGELRPLRGADGFDRIPETELKRLRGSRPLPALPEDLHPPLTSIPLQVHLETLHLLRLERQERRRAQKANRKLERHVVSARVQLMSFQKSLAENAESKAQDQAALEQAKQERDELELRLRQAQSRLAWLETRIPRWLRSLFGAA